uniref:MAGE domain-containing protein n=1 Tax=Gopherus evgoodei TaxID=1825980 RepID=A0A8C5F1B1_9SAUR
RDDRGSRGHRSCTTQLQLRETFSVARDLIVLTKLRALKLLVPPVQTVPPKGKPSVLHPLWQNETGRLRWIRRFLGCSWWRDSKHHIYIPVSNLPRLEVEKLKKDDWTANLGLLNIILSFLFMKGNDAKESPGWELLRRPRVDPGMRHEVFGDVNKLVTEESLRQKYLEYNRIPHTDPSKFEFQMQILGFVAKIQNKDLTAWSTKYTELAAEEAAVVCPMMPCEPADLQSRGSVASAQAEPDPGDLARPLLAPAPIREN